MNEYRIVEITRKDKTKRFRVEKRIFLFFWEELYPTYEDVRDARIEIKNIKFREKEIDDLKIVSEKVVG